jgi:MFS family permease
MNSKHNRVFYGWWVVAAAAVGLFWGVPVTVYSFTAFLKPLMQDFHVGRAAVSLAFSLALIVSALSTPLTGWLIGRYGARKVILPATTMFAAVLLCNKALSTSLWHFWLFYAVLGILVHGMGPLPYGNVVTLWFDRHRGLALGLMMVGIGAGAIIMPSFAHVLIARYGWHSAYAILGSLVLVIPLPVVAAFLKEKPQDLRLLPDGATPALGAVPPQAELLGLSRYDAWRSRTFWLLVCAFSLVSVSVQGCLVHMTAMLTDRGIAAQTAALGASVVGAAVLIGRVGAGYLLDRSAGSRVAAVFFGGAAVGIGLLMIGNALSVAFLGAFLVGLGLGAEVDMIAYLVSRYFGLRSFAEIYSLVFGAFGLAGAFGPLIMGAAFDLTGSYHAPLIAFSTATLVAAVLMTRLGPYRYRAGRLNEGELILPVQTQDQPCET